MRRNYSTPVLRSQRLELGVFGDYGQGGGEGEVTPRPTPAIDRFEIHLD